MLSVYTAISLTGFVYADHPYPPGHECATPPGGVPPPVSLNCATSRLIVDRMCHGTVSPQAAPLCSQFSTSVGERDAAAIFRVCPRDVSGNQRNLCEALGYNPATDTVAGASGPITRAQATGGGSVSTGSPRLDSWLNRTINTLSIVVGLVVVGSIIFRGIQYASARDNASQVSAAKNGILMAILALILFMFGFTLLQWLIPGGIFS